MSESQSSVEPTPKKRKGEVITLESSQNTMLLKPCDTLSETHPADTMLLKPCDTLSETRSADTMLLKRCDTLSETQPADTMLLKRCDLSETHPADSMLLKQPPCDTVVSDMKEPVEDDQMPPVLCREKGKPFDLKALLSTKDRDYLVSPITDESVPISSLDQNHVLFCAFSLPHTSYSSTPKICKALQALYLELTQLGIDSTVKLVVVLRLHPSLDESAFRNSFSCLPINCLTVPYSASSDHAWHSLGLNPNPNKEGIRCVAVHPNGILLRQGCLFLNRYGALSFPFTDDHFTNIESQDMIIEDKICSAKHPNILEEILQCSHLARIDTESVLVPVSDLADATVGLYLYIDGSSMDLIQDVHRKCIREGRSFEIILVPVPFDTHDDPAVFCDNMKKSALQNSSWWIYPFNDKICRGLWRLVDCRRDDQLITLPSDGCPGDLYGKQIAFRYGVNAYPFTREVVVESKFRELRSFTLESLLGEVHMLELDLRNKNVVLYYYYDPEYCHRSSDYNYILANYPGSKVIISQVGGYDIGNSQDIRWSIVPEDVAHTVFYRIFPGGSDCVEEPTLVTFGKDGKILSRRAQVRLPRRSTSSSASLFNNVLRHEILFDLTVEMLAESCEEE